MSDLLSGMADISARYADFEKIKQNADASSVRTLEQMKAAQKEKEEGKDRSTLSFEDMLLLMVTQLQNQTIDNQADPNDMMNQLIQMTVMQSLVEVSTQVDQLTQANILNYSASLVGKGVTVGVYNEETESIDEIYGVVTATGTYNGQQVLFIGDDYYPLSSIMAVGKLPEKKPEETDPDKKPEEKPEGPGEAGGGDKTEETDPNKPVEETGGDQEPENSTEENGGTDAAGDESGTEGIKS